MAFAIRLRRTAKLMRSSSYRVLYILWRSRNCVKCCGRILYTRVPIYLKHSALRSRRFCSKSAIGFRQLFQILKRHKHKFLAIKDAVSGIQKALKKKYFRFAETDLPVRMIRLRKVQLDGGWNHIYLEDVNELATAERENENPRAAVEAENPPNPPDNAETEVRR